MCGISGFIIEKNKIDHKTLSLTLSDEIKHRGPDDEGYETFNLDEDKILSLIHRRLSIIDTSLNGHQPMQCNVNKENWIIFNGEIYNYKKIKSQLIETGFNFEETLIQRY